MSEKVYLGDGVYARFDHVRRGDCTLTTEDGANEIYLEPKTIDTLLVLLREHAFDWVKKLEAK